MATADRQASAMRRELRNLRRRLAIATRDAAKIAARMVRLDDRQREIVLTLWLYDNALARANPRTLTPDQASRLIAQIIQG